MLSAGRGACQWVSRPVYESAPRRVAKVIGPFGPLTIADLPSPKTQRWSMRRKAEVIAAVRGNLLSLEEACSRYALNIEEYRAWEYCIDRYGLSGLRTTRTQFYLIHGRRQRSLPTNWQANGRACGSDMAPLGICQPNSNTEGGKLSSGIGGGSG